MSEHCEREGWVAGGVRYADIRFALFFVEKIVFILYSKLMYIYSKMSIYIQTVHRRVHVYK